MKLYYAPGACSTATHIALQWIGKPYDTHKVSIHPEKSPELLEANPSGAVPVVDFDGWILTQNSAILNYLADAYPEAKLGGDGTPKSRAEVNRWLGLVNSDVHPAFKPLFGTTDFLGDDAMIAKSKDNSKATLRRNFEIINNRLADRDWIAGPRSIADPYLFVMIRWAKMMELDMSGLDHVEAFFERMSADAGVKTVLEAESAN